MHTPTGNIRDMESIKEELQHMDDNIAADATILQAKIEMLQKSIAIAKADCFHQQYIQTEAIANIEDLTAIKQQLQQEYHAYVVQTDTLPNTSPMGWLGNCFEHKSNMKVDDTKLREARYELDRAYEHYKLAKNDLQLAQADLVELEDVRQRTGEQLLQLVKLHEDAKLFRMRELLHEIKNVGEKNQQ